MSEHDEELKRLAEETNLVKAKKVAEEVGYDLDRLLEAKKRHGSALDNLEDARFDLYGHILEGLDAGLTGNQLAKITGWSTTQIYKVRDMLRRNDG